MYESAKKRLEAKVNKIGRTLDRSDQVLLPYTTIEEQNAAIRKVIDELHMEIMRTAEHVPSDLNMEVFGSLPPRIIDKMQFIADVCAEFLGHNAEDDKFPTHDERTEFKKAHKKTLGRAFKERFEENRFRLSACTVLVSRLGGFMFILRGDNFAWPSSTPAEERVMPHREEFEPLIKKFEQFVGSVDNMVVQLEEMKTKYHKMTIHEKLDFVDQVSDLAHEYLRIVAIPEPAVEAIQQSQI